jgi:tetratricopeptide (TPR) repeat protein
VILCVFAALCVSNIFDYSPTYDEPKFLHVGERLLAGEGWQTEMSVVHAPLSFYTHGLLLKPFAFAGELHTLRWARITMLPYALALGVLVYVWAAGLFGGAGGLVALTLYCFNSNILGHSSLITTDVIHACFSLFLLYSFWRYMAEGRKRWVAAAGVSLGLALLSKYSAVMWFILLPGIGAAALGFDYFTRDDSAESKSKMPTAPALIGSMAVIFVLAVAVLNVGYGFTGALTRLGANHYQSHVLSVLAGSPLFSWIPAPVPYPFLRGLDIQKYISETGHPAFLAGMHSTTGWRYFWPACFFLKMPVAFWPIMLMAAVGVVRSGDSATRKAKIILALSSLGIVCLATVTTRSHAGFRYLLAALPPLFVLAGAAAVPYAKNRWYKGAIVFLVCLYAFPALWIHPHHLAFFSRLVGGPKNGYKWLSDSNLDWGQDLEHAREYVRKSPVPVTVNPGVLPVPGRILVNATTLQDCFAPYEIHRWLLPFKPVDYIGYSWLVYDLSEETISDRPHTPGALPDEYYFAAFEYARDRFANAERLAEAVLERNPRLPEAWYVLGLARLAQDKPDGAARAFEAIPASHPLYVEARADLSFVGALRGDDAATRAFWKQSMIGDTLRAYARRPALDSAEYAAQVAARPNDWKARNNLGVSEWAEGDLAGAERDLRSAWELQPNFVEPLANLAIVLEEEGRFGDARQTMRKFNDEAPLARTVPYRDYRVYYQDTRIMLGDTLEIFPKADEEALRLKEHLSRRPDDIAALNRLAGVLARGGRLGETHECLSRALAADPNDATTQTSLAALYTEKKMYSRALRACEAAINAAPDNSSAAELLRVLREKEAASR